MEKILDIDIRHKMKSSILKDFIIDDQSRIVEEFALCYVDARIDIAVINGSLYGYEIKSESDDLRRLPSQMMAYLKIFDYLTVVTSENHINEVFITSPGQCGIVLVKRDDTSKQSNLTEIRPPLKNEFIEKQALIQLLWKDELLDVLSNYQIRGYKSKSKPLLWDIISDLVPIDEISTIVREKIKARSNWRVDVSPFQNDDC